MGCDIHVYRERKVDGIWETDTTVEYDTTSYDGEAYGDFASGMGWVGRSYWLFAALSGVRAYDNPPIKPPAEDRGWPKDAATTNDDCKIQWDSDAHSHGWLTLAELRKLQTEYENLIVLDGSNPEKWDAVSTLIKGLADSLVKDFFDGTDEEDCRIVFFYDN